MPRAVSKKVSHLQFIESMECLAVPKLPEGEGWTYELLCCPPHNNSSVAPIVMWRCHSNVAY
jgi:hypothetical protein